jgi:thiamine-monophosphate kinase
VSEGSPHLGLGEGAEFDAIRHLLDAWGPAAVGIGDDAAILEVPPGERLVVSTDAAIEGVHFRREWMSAEQIGARAACAALSDLAAMAAQPRGLLLSIGLPSEWRPELIDIGRGVARVATSVECPIIGGNISSASELSLTTTVLGSASSPLTRAGVRDGDVIFVTGTFGGAQAALRSLLDEGAGVRPKSPRFFEPTPRIAEARWLAACGARAAIDVSDGLRADATHLARASRISLVLNGAAVPRVAEVTIPEALASGEEYELIVAFRPDELPDADEFARRFGIALTPVGIAVPQGTNAVELTNVGGGDTAGFDHLA